MNRPQRRCNRTLPDLWTPVLGRGSHVWGWEAMWFDDFVTGKSKIWLHIGPFFFFFPFKLSFLLLLFTKRILSKHYGLPWGTLALCLNAKPKCLWSGRYCDPVYLWKAARKKLPYQLPEADHSSRYLQDLRTSSPPPHLYSIKESRIL